MAHYRLRHLLLAPSLLSLSRLVLAACFPFATGNAWAGLVVLALAGASDVLDGWVARRYGLVTATGAVIDGVTDKLFVSVVVVTLLVQRRLSPGALVLLGARELGELPLVVWLAVSHGARALRVENPKANAFGKAATVLQFATVAAVLSGRRANLWLEATAVLGVFAAASYWRRAITRSSPRIGDGT